MKYLCLAYLEESSIDALSEGPADEMADEVPDHFKEFRVSGYVIASSRLQSVQSATTVRVRNGKMSIAEGPFIKSKEQLGGFYLIEARDLNDAIRVASRIPAARIGCIEVRPLRELGQQ